MGPPGRRPVPEEQHPRPTSFTPEADQRYGQPQTFNNTYPDSQLNTDDQFNSEPMGIGVNIGIGGGGARLRTDDLVMEDEVDGPPRTSLHTNVRVNVSTEQEVCESTPDILRSFIADRMEYDGYKVPPALSSKNKKQESAIAVVLRRMGDDISQNYQLNHYISEITVTPNTAYKTFASVACQIFTDGNINWGRVVMLFYFAYKLALQVLNQLPLIDIIIGWVTKFITEKVASWISRQGGWSAVREYYGSTTGQMVGVFLAGILVSTLFWYWKK